jgi:hypothetical protein
MSNDEISRLAFRLTRVRDALATEAPFSPAWAATVEWCDELEAQIRSMGTDPDALAGATRPAARRRRRPAQGGPTSIDRIPAGAR